MANEFLSIKNIARQALPRLIENLVFPNLIYKDYSNTYEVGKGATIQVRKPVVLTASEFDASSGTSAQDVKESSVEVTLDKLATVDAEFGAIARATDVDDLQRLFIEPAAIALASKINDDGLAQYVYIPTLVGAAGTTPDGLDDFANAAKALDDANVPTGMRRGVWNTAAMAKFRQLGDLVNTEKSGTTEALRAGSIGNVFGIDNYMAQGVISHTSAATGTPLIDGGNTKGDTKIHVDGLTAAFAVGDMFTIANDTTKYTVNKVGALETADQDIYITPALVKNAADNAAITVIATATANNLVFHQNAFAFVTRPLAAPAGVESYTTSYNGISLRVTRGYNMQYKKETISMDVLYGYKTLYPELAVRVLG
jgi:hypothetical protein